MPDSTGVPGVPGGDITNNTFDPRIRQIPSYVPGENPGEGELSGRAVGLTHGYMQTAFPKGPFNPRATAYKLNFLYNPSTVQVSHGIDASQQVMPSYVRSDLDQGTPLIASGGTLSFSLLFDRSYETSDSSKFSTIAGTLGVAADIQVLYNLVGINMTQQIWNEATPDNPTSTPDAGATIGVMQMNPVRVIFGQPRRTFEETIPTLARMVYFGYVNSLNISYTHFTQRMVPSRCAVGISVQLMSPAGWAV